MLEVKELNVSRGKIPILWNVNLKVKRGEIVCLIGANGAGKTTLLSSIAGILKPASGAIIFDGKEINGIPPYKVVDLGISFVPEDRKLFPHMTVRENLLMGAYTPKARAMKEENFKLVYQLFPVLNEREKQLAVTLSGGEQRMLAIARGLMSSPDLLMLDEPSQGLSPKVTKEIFEAVKELRDRGISILLAEQNAYCALNCADKACVMETGRITMTGTGQELLNNGYVKEAFLGL
ncbi:MAG: ABC transporter ATP-binding protein [Candidatus Bathyarchaeia archaeon]